MALVNTLKYAPARPPIKKNGRKITMVLKDEPTIAGNKYFIALVTRVSLLSSGCSSWVRWICSTITIASSIIRPIAAAMEPIVIILIVYPIAYKTMNVRHNVIGIVINITELALKDLRKSTVIRIASKRPTHTTSLILFIALDTNSAWL